MDAPPRCRCGRQRSLAVCAAVDCRTHACRACRADPDWSCPRCRAWLCAEHVDRSCACGAPPRDDPPHLWTPSTTE